MTVQDGRKRMAAQTLRDPAEAELLRQYRKTTPSILFPPRL